MLRSLYHSLLRLIYPSLFPIHTLTYYLPAPPKRSSGYREKQFDRLLFQFLKRGHRLISLQTEAHNAENAGGMWVIITVQALRPQRELDLTLEQDLDLEENCEIDGLYYIQD